MTDRAGQQIGNYRLTRLLGKGGFGEVYQARHQLLHREQAIKILPESSFGDPAFRERFIREAQVLAQLDHPNIVHVDELGIEKGLIYLVMPYISGGTLFDILRTRGSLPVDEARRYLEDICAGLAYAHQRGVVHMDLKPGNLLVHESGRLLLSDFGLAHLMKEGAVLGGASLAFGTPFYMAPEHLRGKPDPRSDLYAAGVILYQMLAGRHPFDGTTPEAVMVQHMTQQPPPLRAIRPELPAGLETVLMKALAKQPEQRYQKAGELLADAQAGLAGKPVAAGRLPPPAPQRPPSPAPPSPRSRRGPSLQLPRSPGALICVWRGHQGPVEAVAWSPDGRRVASASRDKTAQVWDGLTADLLSSFQHTSAVEAVAWSPDGALLATGGAGNIAHIWSAAALGNVFTYQGQSGRGQIRGVAWSPDGRRIASWGNERVFEVWDALNGANALLYAGHTAAIGAAAWSPDAQRLVSGSDDGTARLWSATRADTLLLYIGHGKPVRAVAWSPDGRRVASAGADSSVQVWDALNGSTLLIYRVHASKVNAVAWSPDGRRIASADADGTVLVWDAATGGNSYSYRGHTQEVSSLAWSPDGARIASASKDKTVQVWQAG